MKIGKGIRTVRKQASLTQQELAHMADLTQTYLSQVESGQKNNPSTELIERIAKACRVSPIVVYVSAMEPEDIKCTPKYFRYVQDSLLNLITNN